MDKEDYARMIFEARAAGQEIQSGAIAYINGGGERDVLSAFCSFATRIRVLLSVRDRRQREENGALIQPLLMELSERLKAYEDAQSPIRTDPELSRSRLYPKIS